MTVRAVRLVLFGGAKGLRALAAGRRPDGAIYWTAPPFGQNKWLCHKVGRVRERVKVSGYENQVARSQSRDLPWAARLPLHVNKPRHLTRTAESALERAWWRPRPVGWIRPCVLQR